MPGPPPKAPEQRRRTNADTFPWVTLPPEGRKGPAPKLPPWRQWSTETKRWWRARWRTPQATQWDQSGSTLWAAALLYDELQTAEPGRTAALVSELRQHEDRHGLSPRALLQLRWRIGAVEPEAPAEDDRRAKVRRLQVKFHP